MQLTCPACGAIYDVPETAIGANGRRVRCRACQTSWFEPPRVGGVPAPPVAASVALRALPVATGPAPPAPVSAEAIVTSERSAAVPPRASRGRVRVPWLLLALGVAVVALGAVAAMVAWGPDEVAGRLGLASRRVPLGIAITREPDWRLIAGGSQLFAVSGRIWNPTAETQPVPDLRADLRDASGRVVYAWTIARPVAALAPGAAATFDGAAVDVPPSSAKVSVRFAGADGS